jgi:PhoH-like ATPase
LALAAALECRTTYRQILLARPVVPLSNRDLGFLPGDIAAKLDPYMQPLFDNLSVIRHQFSAKDSNGKRIQEMLESEKLVITPLAYIRGRSLQRAFLIVDEAQNLTPHEVKTIITRAGEGTKVIFTGDIQQIDHPYLDSLSNGMSYLINRMVGQAIYAHITLEKGERSALADLATDLL